MPLKHNLIRKLDGVCQCLISPERPRPCVGREEPCLAGLCFFFCSSDLRGLLRRPRNLPSTPILPLLPKTKRQFPSSVAALVRSVSSLAGRICSTRRLILCCSFRWEIAG